MQDGPRERLRSEGETSMAADELVALVLGAGLPGVSALDIARRLLRRRGGLASLSRARLTELCAEPGVGEARAARLVAAFALGRRAILCRTGGLPTVSDARDVDRLMRPLLSGLEVEVLWVLALDVKNRVIDRVELGRGTLTSVDVHPREVYRFLTVAGAAAGVVVHNHPSGDPTPSRDDVQLTERLVLAGQLLGIPLVDHVIVAADGFESVIWRVSAAGKVQPG